MVEKILDVPFIKQLSSYCGPASLAMVMQYHGVDVSQNEIGNSMMAQYFGATVGDLVKAAEERGFRASITQNGLKDIVGSIDQGNPLIVLQQKSLTEHFGHYRVVVGYDSERVIIHDPELGDNFSLSNSIFSYLWDIQGFKDVAILIKS